MKKQIILKITHNIYGNFRGFITGNKPYLIGGNEFDAKSWLKEQLNKYPNAIISELSYFKNKDIE